jgi:hypothetical protein
MYDIAKAKRQLEAYDPGGTAKHYIYLKVCFDESVGDCHEAYFKQIDEYLLANPVQGIELVFQPDTNYFNRTCSMKSATVVG